MMIDSIKTSMIVFLPGQCFVLVLEFFPAFVAPAVHHISGVSGLEQGKLFENIIRLKLFICVDTRPKRQSGVDWRLGAVRDVRRAKLDSWREQTNHTHFHHQLIISSPRHNNPWLEPLNHSSGIRNLCIPTIMQLFVELLMLRLIA